MGETFYISAIPVRLEVRFISADTLLLAATHHHAVACALSSCTFHEHSWKVKDPCSIVCGKSMRDRCYRQKQLVPLVREGRALESAGSGPTLGPS